MILEITRGLHNAETQLPQRPLKNIYDRIRQNPAWYLRKELTNDCVGRGGCCSRSCGCCEKRCLTSKERSTGNCTELCYCCGVNRSYSISGAEWEIVMTKLGHKLQSKNPSYLLAMTEAYFSKPGIFGLGKMSMVRSFAWYWKKGSLWQWKRVSKWFECYMLKIAFSLWLAKPYECSKFVNSCLDVFGLFASYGNAGDQTPNSHFFVTTSGKWAHRPLKRDIRASFRAGPP